jgi:hypothetical protein
LILTKQADSLFNSIIKSYLQHAIVAAFLLHPVMFLEFFFPGYDAKSWRPSVTSTTGKTIKAEFSIPVCVTAIQSWGNPHTGDYTISYQLYYDDVHGLSDAEYEDGVRRQGNSRVIF